MLFHSLIFVIFAVLFYAVWPWAARRDQTRWAWLTIMSFLFYGWWDWRFLGLIVASGLLDFHCGLAMRDRPEKKRFYLALSLLGNLGSLALFKYSGFFLENLNAVASVLGTGLQLEVVRLPLPVGISFYTFQSMSYTLDIYRGDLEPTESRSHFFAYLAMFPQLVAGPILRARELLPQLTRHVIPDETARFEGMRWIAHGYFKKVIIADSLAPFVDKAFESLQYPTSGIYWWVVAAMFAAQIYCDFSGYSDIARGLARWMGYEFPANFEHPYTSRSLREFWGRWHISLSTWFRDYLYLPLGGSRQGRLRTHINAWITMIVSGFWHGAAWTYVAWGALHAAFRSFERETGWPEKLQKIPGGGVLAALLVLAQVLVAWVFFRAPTMAKALTITGAMLTPSSFDAAVLKQVPDKAWIWLTVLALREAYVYGGGPTSRFEASLKWRWVEPVMLAVMLTMAVFLRGEGQAFIYFQF